MKKIVFALMVLMTFNTQAQKKMNLTAEQSATLISKEMTLQLDLNQQQQKQVYTLAKERAEKHKAMRENKKDRKEMSDEQRYDAKVARLDSQLKMQREMKAILNEQQYQQWKKLAHKKEKEIRKKKSEHREKRNE